MSENVTIVLHLFGYMARPGLMVVQVCFWSGGKGLCLDVRQAGPQEQLDWGGRGEEWSAERVAHAHSMSLLLSAWYEGQSVELFGDFLRTYATFTCPTLGPSLAASLSQSVQGSTSAEVSCALDRTWETVLWALSRSLCAYRWKTVRDKALVLLLTVWHVLERYSVGPP